MKIIAGAFDQTANIFNINLLSGTFAKSEFSAETDIYAIPGVILSVNV
jgi:hypothetical protein